MEARSAASCSAFDSVFNEIDADIRRLRIKGVGNSGSFSTPASSSANLTSYPKDSVPCATNAQMRRMRELNSAVEASRNQAIKFREQTDPQGSYKAAYDRYQDASILQNQEIIVDFLRKRTNELRSRIARRRILLGEILEEQTNKELRLQESERELERAQEKGITEEADISRITRQCTVLAKLIRSRRKDMIDDLFRSFRIQIESLQSPTTSVKKCSCINIDLITGIHLPRLELITGHSEPEVSAALGNVVNLLRCLVWVLDLPLPYPVLFGSSRSHIYDPKKEKKYALYGLKNKTERAQIEAAVQLLNTNLAQLRYHFGFETSTSETLRLIYDIYLWTIKKRARPALDRPFASMFSAALLVEAKEQEEIPENVRNDAERLLHTLDVSKLCLDDSPTKIVRYRSVTMGEEAVDTDDSAQSANSYLDTAIGL